MMKGTKKKSDIYFYYWEALASLPRYQHSYSFLMQHFNQNVAIIQYWFESTRWFDNYHAKGTEATRLYNVSLLKLANFILATLNTMPLFRRAIQLVKSAPHCVRLGFYSANRRAPHSVLLGLAIDEGELEKMINHVLTQATPSVLLLPSIDDVSSDNLQALRMKDSHVMALQQWQTEKALIDDKHVIHTFNHFIKTSANTQHVVNTKDPYHFSIPAGANWEDITFQFKDGHTVEITCHHQGETVNDSFHYSQMRMIDNRNHMPNQLWVTLKLLAENGGRLIWPSHFATSQQRMLIHQLVKALQAHCNLYTPPFASIKNDRGCAGHQALFTVLPES